MNGESRGRVSTEYTAWCGQCEQRHQEGGPRTLFLINIRRLGWRESVEDGWRCPACSGAAPQEAVDARFADAFLADLRALRSEP